MSPSSHPSRYTTQIVGHMNNLTVSSSLRAPPSFSFHFRYPLLLSFPNFLKYKLSAPYFDQPQRQQRIRNNLSLPLPLVINSSLRYLSSARKTPPTVRSTWADLSYHQGVTWERFLICCQKKKKERLDRLNANPVQQFPNLTFDPLLSACSPSRDQRVRACLQKINTLIRIHYPVQKSAYMDKVRQ